MLVEEFTGAWDFGDSDLEEDEHDTGCNQVPAAESKTSSSMSDVDIPCTVKVTRVEVHADMADYHRAEDENKEKHLPTAEPSANPYQVTTNCAPCIETEHSMKYPTSAQEIVDIIQSDRFVLDSGVLRSGSSQCSLFTGCEGRSRPAPSQEDCSKMFTQNTASGSSGRRVTIPLNEVDTRGVALTWEDWGQELQTLL